MDEALFSAGAGAGRGGELTRRVFLQLTGAAVVGTGAVALAERPWPASSTKTIRLGVVGGGFGATFWWHEHPRCKVTGVTDLREDRRRRLRQRYRCDAVYDSLETMVKEAKDIDAVAVFSGAPDHARHVKVCMDRGWHVVSAVPACISLEEAAMLKEVKEKTGLHYMMAESSYYRQECIFAREFYRQGGFGELFYSEVEYYHDSVCLSTSKLSYEPDGSHSWRYGYPPMLYPTHCTGYLVGVTGERVTKVSCLGWHGEKPREAGEPTIAGNVYGNRFWCQSALMLTDRGHMCRCNVFWRCVAGGERAQWFGDKASLYMPLGGIHGAIEHDRGQRPRSIEVPQYWKTSPMIPEPMRHASGHGGSAVFITAEFINALVEDRQPECHLYDALAMTVPGIVAHQSAFRDGEQLEVPQFDNPDAPRSGPGEPATDRG
ncbi:MAG TPA: Gfo/Idh/MocA family oxidoreductase [Planctomycetaceae bacterium]|nr:Gfo/Idh/MocA family oxidoreductase [Planctomycetaceae bacterium]